MSQASRRGLYPQSTVFNATVATAFALGGFLNGCAGEAPALPQWTVIVATDAPVPQFGDRLQIDVLDDTGNAACSGCQRQFAVNDTGLWPLSFGVKAAQAGLHVRARLFRADLIGPDGTPTAPALIDRIELLPATMNNMRVTLILPMKCFGVPAEPANGLSCDSNTGLLAPEIEASSLVSAELPVVNSWSPAIPVPCGAENIPSDMACIPGGVFLLGNPTLINLGGVEFAPTPEHVVVLAPFLLDRDELTVQAYLNLKKTHPSLPEPLPQGSAIQDGAYCTYGGNDAAMPLNCVTRSTAQAICAAQGRRLPREAEWEYAAGNLNLENAFPWGFDDNVCKYAILARDGIDGASLCRAAPDGGTYPVGPVSGGAAGDATTLGIRNLGGNVSEWVADDFQAYTGTCWSSGASPLVNPICVDTVANLGSVRGGNWQQIPLGANVSSRNSAMPSFASPMLGVRCARD